LAYSQALGSIIDLALSVLLLLPLCVEAVGVKKIVGFVLMPN